ncbi:unnamed protein product [Staurois parvus]|uniref:Protein root UVB sensitive/RUS domain-containing protein n=1 Tax=Staurois parvus TaxID=386267 RepID=A0ABN9GKB2_9NEOB|nr:unnamed protein product [Staurois parvus]
MTEAANQRDGKADRFRVTATSRDTAVVGRHGCLCVQSDTALETFRNICGDKDGHISCQRETRDTYGSLRDCLVSLFLPHGFPDSVSDDYVAYQLWDTVQAFASSVTGSLATHSLLRGSGVGDSSATVAAATVTWILKDGTGMVGRILFAWIKGSQLDCDAKRWRLFADVLNDMAIFMEIVAPVFPSCFTLMVCTAGTLQVHCGGCWGATRAALTVHLTKPEETTWLMSVPRTGARKRW